MNKEENLISRSSPTDKKSLQKELESARELISNYEAIIADLKLENSNILKTFTHDLSNPLQILSMTVESLQDNPNQNIALALERMQKATSRMTAIIQTIRKLQATSLQLSRTATRVV